MQNQSITLKLDLPEFIVQETITDQKGDLLVFVKVTNFPTCPECGGCEVSLHDLAEALDRRSTYPRSARFSSLRKTAFPVHLL